MIQRIQTIYLVFGSLILAGNYMLAEVWIGPASVQSGWFTPVTLGLYSLALIGGVFSIFLYKNLERQRQSILAVAWTAFLGLIVLSVGLYVADVLPFVSDARTSTQSWLAIVLPLSALANFELARRSVNRDVKLLRSVDRLR